MKSSRATPKNTQKETSELVERGEEILTRSRTYSKAITRAKKALESMPETLTLTDKCHVVLESLTESLTPNDKELLQKEIEKYTDAYR